MPALRRFSSAGARRSGQTLALAAHRALGSATSGLRPIELVAGARRAHLCRGLGRAGDVGVVAQVDGASTRGMLDAFICNGQHRIRVWMTSTPQFGHRARTGMAAPWLRSSVDAGGVGCGTRGWIPAGVTHRASAEPGAVPGESRVSRKVELRSGYHLMVAVATINA